MMEQYTWLFWDVGAVLILVYLVYQAAARGLVRTVISFLGYFIAAGAAGIFSAPVAHWLYNRFVRDMLVTMLQGRVEGLLAQGTQAMGSLAELLPAALRLIALPEGGVQMPAASTDSAQLVQEMIHSLLERPVISILRALSFFVLFSVILFVVRRIAKLFTGLHRVPVIGTVNTFLGGVIGALQGIVALYLLAVAVNLVIVLTGNRLGWLNASVMEATYLLRFFIKLAG